MVSSPSSARGAARVALVVSLGGIALAALIAPSIPAGPAPVIGLFPPGDTTTVYGPTQLSTPNGNPTNHVNRFAVAVTPGKRYTLRMVNGAPNGSSKVTGGTVQLNGWETMTSADLASGATLERMVQVRTEDTLFVTVQGPAGAYVTASVLSTPDPTFLVFGPAHFVRTTGTPVTETRYFSISPTAAPPYRFCLVNGDIDGTNRVSSASIVLNGQEVFTQSQFNQHVSSLMTQVALQPANTLLVTLSGQPGGFLDLCVTATDTTPPVITINTPTPNLLTNDTIAIVSGSVFDETPTTVAINGATTTVGGGGAFTDTVALVEGSNAIHIVATDAAGHTTDSTRTVIRDRTPPVLTVNEPVNGFITNVASLPVSGSFVDAHAVTVNVNGTPLNVTGTTFSGSFLLAEGTNILLFNGTDAANNPAAVVMRTVKLDTQVPVIALNSPAEGDTIAADSATLVGTVTDVNPKTLTANGIAIPLGQNGSFTGKVPLTVGPNTITLLATDSATNSSAPFVRHVVRKNPLPPDPATVATAINRTEATLIKENTAFLYTGPTPIQEGVTATIDTLRAAVVRGRVLDRTLQPLSGALVSIKGRPEFGHTTSRADGGYDLAVNGGGSLVLAYSKGGYLPAQRTVEVPWQDYTPVEDVILVQPDPVVTVVDLTAPGITIARGSIQTDADGARQATVFFEAGTKAALKHPNGTIDTLTTLSVRATEFTVGENGEEAMPGELPPSSQYTYAVQVTADAQLAEPGATLTFTQPVPVYVENFLDLDSLKTVPVGVYNPDSAKWLPRPNGLMVKVTGTDAQGRALLDINGDGIADSDALLAFNGIDSLERVRLAGTYPANSRLWRVPIIEALPHDLNWPFTILGGTEPKTLVTGPCGSKGADVLRCSLQAQTAFQNVGIVGSPFTLNYASDRTRGNVAERSLDIQLVGATVPPFLERVDLEITIAGRLFETSFTPTANLSYHFVWDGKDVYGRTVQATQPAVVKVGYLYPVVYSKPAASQQSFGLPCNATTGSCTVAAVPPAEADVRALRRIWEGTETTLGGIDAAGLALGGFTLDVQHAYDPLGGILYNGDGTRRTAATLPDQVTRWAGNGNSGGAQTPVVNGKHRLAAQIDNPAGIVVAPDGSVILAEPFRGRVLKVSPNDTISTVAGLPTGPIADSGTATALKIQGPQGIALGPDGSVYFAEQNGHRIRQVTPQGFMRTIAGDGTCGFAGDTGLAKAARICQPTGLGIAPDGSIYFADQGNVRIRRIGPDRRISTVAGFGTAVQCFLSGSGTWPPPPPQDFINICKDGSPASQAPLRQIQSLAVGPDGSVYFSQGVGGKFDARIRRVDPSGIIRTVVGSDRGFPPVPLTVGDGGSALQARLQNVWAIAIGPDGSIYFADEGLEQLVNGVPQPGTGQNRVRRVRPDGLIQTVAGDGVAGSTGDNGPARRARIQRVEGIAFLPDGSMLISDDAKVRKVSPPLPGLAGGQTVIASRDGNELYVFSAAGRILLTLDALTRDTLLRFSYDANRTLIGIVDRHGRETDIVRDATGRATAVIARNGEQTTFAFDAAGNLSGVLDPAGGQLDIAYRAGGLLDGITGFEGDSSSASYDASGLLAGATSPSGGTYGRTITSTDTSEAMLYSSPLGRTSTTQVSVSPTGSRSQSLTLPSGKVVQTTITPDGKTVTTYANGMVATVTELPDPIVGMQSPMTNLDFASPSGLTMVQRSARAVTFSDSTNPATLLTQTDSVILNGRIETTVFTKATRTIVRKTPFGRRTFVTLDAAGRVASESLPGLTRFTQVYDSLGRLRQRIQGSRVVSYTYNAAGLMETLNDALGRTTRYAYDGTGLMTKLITTSQDTVLFSHSGNGHRIGVQTPGRPPHTFTFSPSGAMETATLPDVGGGSWTTRWFRNADGQVERIIDADSQETVVSYDTAGRITSSVSPIGPTTFTYDPATGNVATASSPQGITLTHEWDGTLASGFVWSGAVSGTVRAVHNNNFWTTQQTVNGQSPISFTYDSDGLLTTAGDLTMSRNTSNGLLTGTSLGQVTSTLIANAFAEPSDVEYKIAGVSALRFVYGRDAGGRIQAVTESRPGSTVVLQYAYDSAGRVATVTRDGVIQATYEYDANGNRLRVTRPGGTSIGVYDAQDRVVTYGQTSYIHNRAGQLVRRIVGTDTTSFSYSPSGKLLGASLSGGVQVEYLVDAEGRRVGKRINGTLVQGYLYSGSSALAAELDGSNNVVSRFVYGSAPHVPDYVVRDGQTFRLISDYMGSVRLVVNTATGAIIQRLDYDEFGRVLTNTNPGFQPFAFAGGRLDLETGLIHFAQREYDPETGRWTTRDPRGFERREWNQYAYVAGDPVNALDPEGGYMFLGSEFFFRGLLRKIGEEILWNLAFDIASGCAGSLLGGGGGEGCLEEAAIAFVPISWGTSVAGGAMLATYFPNRGQPGNAGQFRSGPMGRFGKAATFFAQCVSGMASEVAEDALFGEGRNDLGEWIAIGAYGCGSAVIVQIVDFTLAARKYPSWKVKALAAFSGAILNTLFTAWQTKYDAAKAGEPWSDAQYPDNVATRKTDEQGRGGGGAH